MNRDLIDRYCERGILALMLMILVTGPLSAGAVATRELVMLMTLTVGVLGLWLVRLWVNERPKVLWPPVCWAVLAFAVYAVWRYTNSDIEYLGRLEVLRVLVYAALFFAIINNLHRQETTQIIGFTLIFLAMFIAACAIWQFMTRADKVPALSALLESFFFEHKTWYFARVYLDRASGTYINPNHLAGLLEMLLPLAMAYVVAGRARPVTKIFLGYAALVMLTGIAVTGSRGSWAATGVSLFLLFAVMATHRSYRLPALAMLVILIGGGIYLVAQNNPFRERLAKTFVGGEVELDMRSDIWTATTDMWRDHLWLGVGPGHFNARWREYRPPRVQLQPDRAHNDYLNLLVDWGVVGGTIVAGLLVSLALGLRKTWGHVRRSESDFKSNRSDKFAFVAGATFGLVALAVHAVVDFNLHIPANAIIAVTLAALLCSHVRFATEQHWAGAGVALKSVISLFLCVGLIGLTHQSLRLGREYVWLTHASGKGNYSDEKIRDLEKAHAIEPWNFETTFELGECYRVQSAEGGIGLADGDDADTLAQKAILWYRRGTNANPHDGYNFLGIGRCLDFPLGRTNESPPYYSRADELDPNGYFTTALVGWHYIQTGDYAAARPWLERSLRLQRTNNLIAASYLTIANERLLERAMRPDPAKP